MHYNNIFILIALILPQFTVSQVSVEDFEKIYSDIKSYRLVSGEKKIILDDSTVCILTLQSGIKQGRYKSYYPDGKLKAKGWFTDNRISGKWKVYAPDKKRFLVLDYAQREDYQLKRVRLGFLKNPVIFGRGKIKYQSSKSKYTVSDEQGEQYTGIVHIRKGKKNGYVNEYYINGNIRAEYKYSNGLYDGLLTYYYSDNAKIEAKYKEGVPAGIWLYKPDSHTTEIIQNYNLNPFQQRITGRGFVHEFETAYTVESWKIIPACYERNAELFEKDSSGVSLYSVLADAFLYDETFFYINEYLTNIIMSSVSRPTITGLPEKTEKKLKPVMIFYKERTIFSTQHSGARNIILPLTMLLSYTDDNNNEVFVKLPYVYYPDAFYELKEKIIHGKKLHDLLLKIIHNYYISIPIYHNYSGEPYYFEKYHSDKWIEIALRNELQLIDYINDFWLEQAGLKNSATRNKYSEKNQKPETRNQKKDPQFSP